MVTREVCPADGRAATRPTAPAAPPPWPQSSQAPSAARGKRRPRAAHRTERRLRRERRHTGNLRRRCASARGCAVTNAWRDDEHQRQGRQSEKEVLHGRPSVQIARCRRNIVRRVMKRTPASSHYVCFICASRRRPPPLGWCLRAARALAGRPRVDRHGRQQLAQLRGGALVEAAPGTFGQPRDLAERALRARVTGLPGTGTWARQAAPARRRGRTGRRRPPPCNRRHRRGH